MSTPTNGPDGYPQGPVNGAPQQGYPQQQPPKKRKKWPWVVGILALLALLLFGGCAVLIGGALNAADKATNDPSPAVAQPTAEAGTPAATDPAATQAGKTVTLRATSSSDGMVAFGNSSTQSSQNFSGEWSKDLTLEDWVDAATLSVTSATMGGDNAVTCEIIYNGKVVVKNDSSGDMSSASCTATSAELK